MQQGDMVVVVRRMLSKISEDDALIGKVGVIVRPTTAAEVKAHDPHVVQVVGPDRRAAGAVRGGKPQGDPQGDR